MQEKNQGNYAFINEKIKQKPLNKKKLAAQVLFVAAMAVLFGIVSSFVFAYCKPKFEEKLYPKKDPTIEIPMDETTEIPQTEETETEQQSEQASEQQTSNEPLQKPIFSCA